MNWESIVEFIQANGYKDFMTYFMLIAISLSFIIYLLNLSGKKYRKTRIIKTLTTPILAALTLYKTIT